MRGHVMSLMYDPLEAFADGQRYRALAQGPEQQRQAERDSRSWRADKAGEEHW